MSRLSIAVCAALCLGGAYAKDYYVDAVNGDDANDGLAAGEGRAKESFAALFSAYSINSGDKVHAAAGIYTNGVMLSGSTKYRLVVPAGVEVIGAGADATTIEGQAHTNELGEVADLTAEPWGCGANALRGVYLGQGSILRKVMVTRGYSTNYSGQHGGGVYSESLAKCGYLVDCIITGCVANRGAGSVNVTALRCHFHDNRSGNTGSDIWGGSAFNCLFGNCLNTSQYNLYQGGPYVNNTFYGTGSAIRTSSAPGTALYNSVLQKDINGHAVFTNCIVSGSGTLGGGSYKYSISGQKLDANKRPLRTSPCVDAGDLTFYTNNFPTALADEMWTDYLGNARKAGANIDAGACESPFTKNGAFDWHVDAVNGSDENDGTSADRAFQTLQAALANTYLRSNDTVHAAAGMYTNGVTTSNWRFRAVVPAGVALVGDAGAEKTFIVGDPDPGVELDSSPYGCGSGATLCVRLREGSSVRGFTLTGGRAAGYDGNNFGAAVYCGDDRVNSKTYGYVVDCIITNNCAARGAGVFGAVSIRCRFSDNRASQESSDIRGGQSYNCLFGDVANTGTYNIFGSLPCVNGTFFGTGAAGSSTRIYNGIILKDVGNKTTLTNCVYTGSFGSGSSAGGNSRKAESVEAVHLDASYRPLRNSPALDKGDASFYALPDALADEAGYDFLKATRVQGLGIDLGAIESSETSIGTNWYVNAETGSDANDGATEATAFKTLAAAMTNEWLIANDVVHVAAGVYSTETMTANSKKYRVVVPAGVTLWGAGADVTTIEGAEDRVNGNEAGHYCGADAVACVRLNVGSILRGFTLTNGHSPAWTGTGSFNWGGAVIASVENNDAYVVDCVITNNFAGRGAGLYGGTAIRCRFSDNGVATTGTDIIQGRAWNCIFGGIVDSGGSSLCNVYQSGPYVNCTFHGTGTASHDASDSYTNIWNCIVLKTPGSRVKVVNSVTTGSAAYCGEGSTTMTKDQMMLDENYAPMAGSPLIDSGRNDLYYAKLTDDVAEVLAKTDLAEAQRVYNGAIDIGAIEYDWRDDFRSRLHGGSLSVVEADPGVVTNITTGLIIPAGASVTLDWDLRYNGEFSFKAVATGEGVSVVRDGEAMTGSAEGVYMFRHVGERTTTRIVISCDGESSAVIRDFRGSGGMTVLFK